MPVAYFRKLLLLLCASLCLTAFQAEAQLDATISSDVSSVCQGGSSPVITFTGSGGTAPYTFNYTLNGAPSSITTTSGSSVTLDVPTTSAGSFTYALTQVTDNLLNTQPVSGQVIVTVTAPPNASIAYSGSPYCSNGGTAPVTFSGSAGGTYFSTAGLTIDPSTGAVDLGTSTPGNYTVTYTVTGTGGCSDFSTTADLTITAAPSATISYAGSPFCSNAGTANVTLTGTAGGTFSSTPVGLTLNTNTGAVDLATSAPGTYTVTYTVTGTGGCTDFSANTGIIITAAPSATISYAGSPFCSNAGTANVTLTGTAGGTFSSTPVGLTLNTNTGAVDLATSAPGTYTVTYTVTGTGGCSDFSTTADLTITAAPSATISYAGSPFCSNAGTANVTLTGTAGGTFSSTPVGLTLNTNTGAVDLATSAPGTYTVTYTVTGTGGCTDFSANTGIIITAAPSATISYAGTPFCTGAGTANVTLTGTAGGTFSSTPVGLTLNTNTGAVDLATSAPGTYTVTYTVTGTGGCTDFSANTGIIITAAPSATISYAGTPFCAGAGTAVVTLVGTGGGTYSSTAGLNIDGTTGDINLATSTPGNYTVTYTVATGGGCAIFTTTTQVTITATPTATISYAGSPFCAGAGTATVTLVGTAGGTYSSTAGLTINPSTGAVNLGTSTPGTYTVTYAIAAAGGCSAFSTTTNITISTTPTATISYAGSPFCAGAGTATVTLTGTAGGTYSSTAGLTINPSTGAVNLGTSTPGTYTVTYAIAAAGGCSAFSTTTNMTISTTPSATISYAGSPFCAGAGTATVTLTGTAGGTYSSTAGLTINPSTGAVNLGTSTPGTYTVTYAIAAAGGCSAFSTTTNITISTSPSATISYAGSPFCAGAGTATVTLTGTAGGTYSSTAGLTINPSTGAVNLGTSTPGTYTVTYAIAAAGGCSAFSTTTNITISTTPSATISYAGSPFCAGAGTATVTLVGTAGGTYSSTAGLVIDPVTGAVNLGTSTPGTYTVTYAIAAAGGCSAFSTTTNITISTSPSATISYAGSPFCAGVGTATVTLVGTAGGTYSSTAGLVIDPVTGAVNLGTSTPGTYTVTYAIAAAGGCSAFSTTTNITISTSPSATISYAGSPFCAGAGTATVTLVGTAGGTYSSTAGLTINPSTGAVNLGTSTPGTYTVTYAIAAAGGCSAFSTTTNITISTSPSATISYAGSPFCAGAGTATVTLVGTAGGTYSSTAGLTINPSTGAINLTTSTPGTYTVTYTVAAAGGCAALITTTQVTITAAPSATISYAGSPYCSNAGTATVTLTGTAGGVFTWNGNAASLNNSTGAINLATTTPGTFTVTYTIPPSSGCAAFSTTGSITINPLPLITISPNSASILVGGSVDLTASGASTYIWSPATGLSATAGATVTASPTTTTTYTVVGTSAAGCQNNSSVIVAVSPNPPPIVTIAPTSASICSGGSVSLTASGAATYSWSPSAGLSATTGATVIASPTVTTTYTVIGTDAFGGIGTSAVTITVSTLPSASILYSGSPYCANAGTAPVTLTGTTGGIFTWDGSAASINASTGDINLSSSLPGSYTVTYSLPASGGCSAVAVTAPVVINPVPVIALSPSSASIFTGGSVSITASGASTYSWSPSTGLSATTGATVTASPTTTTTYTVTGTSAAGCQGSNTVTVAVSANPPPLVAITPSSPTICAGGNTTLTASGASTYSWNPATGLSATTGSSVVASPTVTTTYTVIGTDAFGGIGTAVVTVTVNPAPPLTINPTSVALCVGDNVTLTASGADTYNWSPATGLSATSGAVVTANPGSSTTYTVTGTGSNGCKATSTVPITVNAVPSVTLSPTNATICAGSSVTITASGASTYSWSPATGLSSTTGATVSANPGSTTTYLVTGTNGNGCSSTSTVTITVNPLPVVAVTPSSATIFSGGSVTLTASGASSYSWNPSTGLSSTNTAVVTASPLATTTYTVSGTGANGCVNTANVVVAVTVNPPPIISISPGAATICQGTGVTLTASGAGSYVWSPATGLSGTTGATITANPASTTTYTVTGTDNFGGVGTATVLITVNPQPPVPTLSADGPTTFCEGGSVTLTSSAGAGSQWYKDGVPIADATGSTYSANSSGSYTVVVTDVNGCGSAESAPLLVTVNPLPVTPSLSAVGSTTFCSGGGVILVSSSTTGNQWYKDGALLTGATGPTFTAAVAGNYTVIVTNGNNCSSSPSLPINVTVNPLPTVVIAPSTATIFAGNNVTLTASGAETYSWSPSTGLSGTTGATVTASPIITTTYTVTGVDSNTCTNTTNIVVAVTSKPPPLVIISSGPDTICQGNSVTLTASGANTYSWSPSAGLSDTVSSVVVAAPAISTTYTVTGTDNFGGVSTATIFVKVNPLPDITVTPNPAKIFVGDAVQLNASGAISYLWTPSKGLNDTTKSIVTASPSTTTTYYVKGTGLNGCIGFDTVLVNVFPKPVVKITPSSASICKGGSVRLTASGASTYSWHPSTGISPSNTSIVTAFPTETTTYTVVGTDVNGGVDTATITVTVSDQLASPVVRTAAGNATSLTFQWDAVSGAAGYQVSLDSGATYSNPSSGFAGLTHTVSGLSLNQTVVIWVKAVGSCESQPTRYAATAGNFEFFVPNAFTPNDDGKNDVLLIYGPIFQSIKMRIYNQWGQLVFETSEQRLGWDGKSNGVKQPSGVYAYYLEAVLPDGRKQVYKGSVTLIR